MGAGDVDEGVKTAFPRLLRFEDVKQTNHAGLCAQLGNSRKNTCCIIADFFEYLGKSQGKKEIAVALRLFLQS